MIRTIVCCLIFSIGVSGNIFAEQGFTFSIQLASSNCQLAIWLEHENGEYAGTVYVTRKTGKMGLGNRPGDLDDSNGPRLSTAPVWAYRHGIDYGSGNYYPPSSQPLPDAISSATPGAGNYVRTWEPESPLDPGKYFYYVEVNKSFDFNDNHNYSFYRGQPSIIWKGSVYVGGDNSDTSATIIGHGHIAGADGSITTDLSTLTSALNLITSVNATSNTSPSLTTASLTDATVNIGYNFTIQKNDIDSGDTHTFELLEKPAWLSIGSRTGVLTGTPVIGDVGDNIPVVVRITDSGTPSLSDTLITTIDVFNPVFVESNIPTEFYLTIPYPNPFNPTTTIEYSIPLDGHVRLIIYNSYGQCAKTLINEYQQIGNHTETWNANKFPSGLYFCTLKANGFTQTRKMLLVK